jgi:hypothetical protein
MKLSEILHEVLQPGQSARTAAQIVGQASRQGVALVLSALMIMVPMGQSSAFAQSAPLPGAEQAPPPAATDGQGAAAQGQPLSADQLDQLVAPIALYPDALVAQVLAASTYPTQVVEADRWVQAQGSAPAAQIAAGADSHNWDASVKALVAFPTVLAQMDKNLQWTTDLGNAYYNQPQDVMDSVQAMRQKAQTAGNLRTTQQQTVTTEGGAIAIAPANPAVVYVPVYDPWAVWGTPYPMYPGYYWGPPAGIFWGGLAIGFGVGIGIGLWGHWGWGWGHWGMGWGHGFGGYGGRGVYFNHNTYVSRSSTVINRGFSRPGGPPRSFAGQRGSYARPGAGMNRAGGAANRGGASAGRAGGSMNRGAMGGAAGRPGSAMRGPGGGAARAGGSMNRGAMGGAGSARAGGASRGGSAPRSSGGGGHASGGGGGHSGGGGGGHHGK